LTSKELVFDAHFSEVSSMIMHLFGPHDASQPARIVDLVEAGTPVADVARRFRVSRTTVYKWLRRFDDGDCLEDRRSVAASFPTRITRSTERKIEQLRRKRGPLGWQIASVLGLARSTVIEVLKRFGLARLRDLEPPRMTRR